MTALGLWHYARALSDAWVPDFPDDSRFWQSIRTNKTVQTPITENLMVNAYNDIMLAERGLDMYWLRGIRSTDAGEADA